MEQALHWPAAYLSGAEFHHVGRAVNLASLWAAFDTDVQNDQRSCTLLNASAAGASTVRARRACRRGRRAIRPAPPLPRDRRALMRRDLSSRLWAARHSAPSCGARCFCPHGGRKRAAGSDDTRRRNEIGALHVAGAVGHAGLEIGFGDAAEKVFLGARPPVWPAATIVGQFEQGFSLAPGLRVRRFRGRDAGAAARDTLGRGRCCSLNGGRPACIVGAKPQPENLAEHRGPGHAAEFCRYGGRVAPASHILFNRSIRSSL